MWVTNGANNYTGFSSELYDRLIRLAGDTSLFLRDPESTLGQLRDAGAVRALLGPAEHGTASEQREAREKIRLLLFREAEAILVNDEFPIIPVYFYVNGGLLNPRVHGFSMSRVRADGSTAINLQDLHPLRDMWVDGSAE
jgi:ABC-type oligopeptide transport system substrate-binding subunit